VSTLALIIDAGNTRVKFAVMQNYKVLAKQSFAYEEYKQALPTFIEVYTIEAIIESNVTNHIIELPATLQSCNYVKVNYNMKLPYSSTYTSMDTLGVDRIALVAAAAYHYPNQNTLVIACGTCITYNFLEKNIFRGGAIAPGFQMRLNAMNHYTAKLPLVAQNNLVDLIGADTETSLQSGAFNGLSAEIRAIINDYELRFGKINAVLTGGDMPQLLTPLKNRIFAHSDFLYEGLYHLLLFNT
jgi:type III pantothenate kinase